MLLIHECEQPEPQHAESEKREYDGKYSAIGVRQQCHETQAAHRLRLWGKQESALCLGAKADTLHSEMQLRGSIYIRLFLE